MERYLAKMFIARTILSNTQVVFLTITIINNTQYRTFLLWTRFVACMSKGRQNVLPCTCHTKYQNKELLAPLIGSNNANQIEANKKYFSRVGRSAGASFDITVLFNFSQGDCTWQFFFLLMNWTKRTYTVIKIQVLKGGCHGSAHVSR